MTQPLRPYQIADLAFYINNPFCMNLSDPGTGKTPPTCTYIYYLWANLKRRTLWGMPKSLLSKNKDELLLFTNFKPEDIAIVQGTPKQRDEILRSDAKVFLHTFTGFATEWRKLQEYHHDFRCLMFDEWHLGFASDGSKRTEQLYLASRQMDSVIGMTGTGIKGRLTSIYPALHVIAPQFYGNYANFLNFHAIKDDYGTIIGWKNHERLRNVLAAISIRHSFTEVYGSEAKVIQVEKVEMHPKQREAYLEFEEKAILELEDGFLSAGCKAVEAMRCRQICSHPEVYGLIPIGDKTGKDDRMWIHIEDSIQAEEQLVIFSSLIAEQERIYAQLKAKGVKVALINGSVSGPKRQAIDEQFRSGLIQMIVGSPKTMGVGFNWGMLMKVIFVSLDYDDDSFIQAYRRGIRGKRDKPLLIVVLEYKDSIEQRIFEIIDQKSKEASLVEEGKEAFDLSGRKKEKDEFVSSGVSMAAMSKRR